MELIKPLISHRINKHHKLMLCFHKDEDRHVYFPNLAKVSALADHTIVVNSDQTFFSHDNVCVQKKTYYMTFCRF